MHRMQTTRTDGFAPAVSWLDPAASWEAAARWNALALEWMTRGWQQWLELVTVWPALEQPAGAMRAAAEPVARAQAGAQGAPAAHPKALDSRLRGNDKQRQKESRPAARAASKRPAKRPARPHAAGRSGRSRG
jgi:hypothetical protein